MQTTCPGDYDLASEHVGLASVSCSDGASVGCSAGEFESVLEFEGSCCLDSQIYRLS